MADYKTPFFMKPSSSHFLPLYITKCSLRGDEVRKNIRRELDRIVSFNIEKTNGETKPWTITPSIVKHIPQDSFPPFSRVFQPQPNLNLKRENIELLNSKVQAYVVPHLIMKDDHLMAIPFFCQEDDPTKSIFDQAFAGELKTGSDIQRDSGKFYNRFLELMRPDFLTKNHNLFPHLLISNKGEPLALSIALVFYHEELREICPYDFSTGGDVRKFYDLYQPNFKVTETINPNLINTDILAESKIPVDLYQHQKHSIVQMLNVEKNGALPVRVFKPDGFIGLSDDVYKSVEVYQYKYSDPADPQCYHECIDGNMVKLPPPKTSYVRGGILNDRVGMGKTLTCLSLVLESLYREPIKPVSPIPDPDEDEFNNCDPLSVSIEADMLVDRPDTTVVIAPKHVLEQWKKEINRIEWPPWFKYMTVSTIVQMRKFLRERANYHLVLINWRVFISPSWNCEAFYKIDFGRLIVDEIHELLQPDNLPVAVRIFNNIMSRYRWGVTATLPTETPLVNLLTCYLTNKREYFLGEMVDVYALEDDLERIKVIRNRDLPTCSFKVHTLTEILPASRCEKSLLAYADDDEKLDICCAPSVVKKLIEEFDEAPVTVRDLLNMYVQRYSEMKENLEMQIKERNKHVEELEKEKDDCISNGAGCSQLKRRIDNIKKTISKNQTELSGINYKLNQYKSQVGDGGEREGEGEGEMATGGGGADNEENNCVICFCNYNEDGLHPTMFMKCAHVFCSECVNHYVGSKTEVPCPSCRVSHKPSEIKNVNETEQVTEIPDENSVSNRRSLL